MALRFDRIFATLSLAFLGVLPALPGRSQPFAVPMTLQAGTPGSAIPEDFAGLSFEMQDVLAISSGRHLFSRANPDLLRLFRTLGIGSLRVGGNTADNPAVSLPSRNDLRRLFEFARAARVKVIFTLRLRRGDPSGAASFAREVEQIGGGVLECFAIGNEPNVYLKTYGAYEAELRRYQSAILSPEFAPEAVFCGPGANWSPKEASWARDLARDFGRKDRIVLITEHAYPGGSGTKVRSTAQARDAMLSPAWLLKYETMLSSFAPAVTADGLPYRLEETNSYYNGGARGASNSFAAALWGLDYLHWWAAHGAEGLNFHTGDRVAKGDQATPCWYAAFWTAENGYAVHPIGYALLAFAQGGHGRVVPIQRSGPPMNVTAYGVSNQGALTVTVINKEHGTKAPMANLTFAPGPFYAAADAMILSGSDGDVAGTGSAQLGGASVSEDGTWHGSWHSLAPPDRQGSWHLVLPPATAALVRFHN
jgi:hypothetical protein